MVNSSRLQHFRSKKLFLIYFSKSTVHNHILLWYNFPVDITYIWKSQNRSTGIFFRKNLKIKSGRVRGFWTMNLTVTLNRKTKLKIKIISRSNGFFLHVDRPFWLWNRKERKQLHSTITLSSRLFSDQMILNGNHYFTLWNRFADIGSALHTLYMPKMFSIYFLAILFLKVWNSISFGILAISS